MNELRPGACGDFATGEWHPRHCPGLRAVVMARFVESDLWPVGEAFLAKQAVDGFVNETNAQVLRTLLDDVQRKELVSERHYGGSDAVCHIWSGFSLWVQSATAYQTLEVEDLTAAEIAMTSQE